ncbi:hypothetical protein [Stigmatella aurantiaca]|nr:hypothetical protein [Stigmatella aurantiaca]
MRRSRTTGSATVLGPCYTPAWVVAGLICIAASLLVLRIGRSHRPALAIE